MAALKPPSPASELGQRMINMSVAMIAIVGVIAYFLYTGAVEPDEPVKLTVSAVQRDAASGEKSIPMNIDVRLENNSKERIALTAPNQCEIFRWFLTDSKNEFVQSQSDEGACTQVTVSTALDAHRAMNESFPVELDPNRVRPGEYRIYVRYWGHEANAPVTIR